MNATDLDPGYHRISDVEVRRTAAAIDQLQAHHASLTADLMMVRTGVGLARSERDRAIAEKERTVTLLAEVLARVKLVLPHFDYEGFDSAEQRALAEKAHDDLRAYLADCAASAPKLEVVDAVALDVPQSFTDGVADLAAGRVVPMETALNEPPHTITREQAEAEVHRVVSLMGNADA